MFESDAIDHNIAAALDYATLEGMNLALLRQKKRGYFSNGTAELKNGQESIQEVTTMIPTKKAAKMTTTRPYMKMKGTMNHLKVYLRKIIQPSSTQQCLLIQLLQRGLMQQCRSANKRNESTSTAATSGLSVMKSTTLHHAILLMSGMEQYP